jgi:septal ring factor EnvC (AmiA/AmiB activator)
VPRGNALAIVIACAAVGSLAAARATAAAKHPHKEPAREASPRPSHASDQAALVDPRPGLAAQLAAEQETLAKTIATIDDKVTTATAVRGHRLRAAYRILRSQLGREASPDDRMSSARRRAAARLLIERDTDERALLAAEAARLRIAATATAADAARVDAITWSALAWPAHGKIVRHFGSFEHERSHATLSRRGIDVEVDDHAAAVAPADGVVRYAGPIRGLDHGVILDFGGYFAVVAKLGELALPIGTHVTRGDRLGRAARHRVYLEVRVTLGPGGLPIDPEPLLAD